MEHRCWRGRLRPFSLRDGVVRLDAGEMGEDVVVAMYDGIVLYGEGGDVGVGDGVVSTVYGL